RIAAGRQAEKLIPEQEVRLAADKHESPVWQLVEPGVVEPLLPGRREPLGMQLGVDRVGAALPGMELAPDLSEANVVLAAAQRTRPVSGGERRRLVEEEQLRELAGLHQGRP